MKVETLISNNWEVEMAVEIRYIIEGKLRRD